jgi:hypothetical protein
MQPEEVYRLLHRQTFSPLRVILRDGRVYEIRYPWLAIVGTSFLLIGVPIEGDPAPYADHSEYVPWASLQRVEVLSEGEIPAASA